VTAYRLQAGEGSLATWNAETGEFASPIDRAKFEPWLRAKLTPPFDEAAFAEWRRTQGQLSAVKEA
jgi:hypothetical protein